MELGYMGAKLSALFLALRPEPLPSRKLLRATLYIMTLQGRALLIKYFAWNCTVYDLRDQARKSEECLSVCSILDLDFQSPMYFVLLSKRMYFPSRCQHRPVTFFWLSTCRRLVLFENQWPCLALVRPKHGGFWTKVNLGDFLNENCIRQLLDSVM